MKHVKIMVLAVVVCILAVSSFSALNYNKPGAGLDVSGYSKDKSRGVKQGKAVENETAGVDEIFTYQSQRDYSSLMEGLVDDRHRAIVLNYKGRFARLQSEYQGKLNSLLQVAKADFEALHDKEEKESIMKRGYSYYKQGTGLEDDCDARFYKLLNDMEQELRRENLPLNVVRQAEKEYEMQKEETRKHLLSLAKEYLKRIN